MERFIKKTSTPPDKKSYLLRDIDPDLWHEVKVTAALEDVPIRTFILDMLKQAVWRKTSKSD